MKSGVRVIFKRSRNSWLYPRRREISSGMEIASQHQARVTAALAVRYVTMRREGGRVEGGGEESRGEGGGAPTNQFTEGSAVQKSLELRTALSTGVDLPSAGPHSSCHRSCAEGGGHGRTPGWLLRRCMHIPCTKKGSANPPPILTSMEGSICH